MYKFLIGADLNRFRISLNLRSLNIAALFYIHIAKIMNEKTMDNSGTAGESGK